LSATAVRRRSLQPLDAKKGIINMADKAKIEKRKVEIEHLITSFSQEYLSDEYKKYAMMLLEKLSRKRTYTIERGKIEIWASSIICVIARLNFLFDPSSDYNISMGEICDFFSTKKTTVGNKATEIEKACKIGFGNTEFCNSKISDSFTFVELSNGMVIPQSVAKELGII